MCRCFHEFCATVGVTGTVSGATCRSEAVTAGASRRERGGQGEPHGDGRDDARERRGAARARPGAHQAT